MEDILTLSKLEHLGIDMIDNAYEGPVKLVMERRWNTFVQRLPGCLPLLTSLELINLLDYGEGMVAALGRMTGLTSLILKADDVDGMAGVGLAPESLRHLAPLTALRHLSLSGQTATSGEHWPFLERALPVLQCLPSLVSLDVGHADYITEACIPLFPVQLQTLVVDLFSDDASLDLYSMEENTAVLAALPDRCPSLTSVIAVNENDTEFCLEDFPKINEKLLPWLHVKGSQRRYALPMLTSALFKDVNAHVLGLLEDLEEPLEEALPYLKLLERSGQWNSPKNPCWNFIGSGEPWVEVAQRVSSLCKDIAAAGIKPS